MIMYFRFCVTKPGGMSYGLTIRRDFKDIELLAVILKLIVEAFGLYYNVVTLSN